MYFDFRLPDFASHGRPELFEAALAHAIWADEHGVGAINLGEHHASDDGYNPAPLVAAGAIAAVTSRVRIRPLGLTPLYDLLRLAE
jgi:alkanesulfonate monooxygenase SsuD/methylene tetrahydromethanopterin reductase-like flavin-dependent oxidoreductase (luciferase family)